VEATGGGIAGEDAGFADCFGGCHGLIVVV
jgi:hypothetical protein